MVTHQSSTNPMAWKKNGRENCGYYFDHWNQCREVQSATLGYSSTANTF